MNELISGMLEYEANDVLNDLDELCSSISMLHNLIAQLAPEEPINNDEQGGCVWCGHSERQWFYETGQNHYNASMYSDKRPETHKPDCPWLIAQQVLNDNSNIRK